MGNLNHIFLEKHWKKFTPLNFSNYKQKYSLNIVQCNCSLNNRPCFSGCFKEWADPVMEPMAICFCLLPVTGSRFEFGFAKQGQFDNLRSQLCFYLGFCVIYS